MSIPRVVRTTGGMLGNRTVLAVISEDGVEPVYAYLEQLFAYIPR